MGILSRFKSIMDANINDLLDKAEDPAKMVEQCIRDMEKDLSKVKSETAAVMAEASRTERLHKEALDDVNKYQHYAELAVQKGNDSDARKFLAEKNKSQARANDVKSLYETAKQNADNMEAMYRKLNADLSDLRAKKDNIKAKMAVAKTQQNINKITNSASNVSGSMGAFNRFEAKANQLLDKANAEASLNDCPDNDFRDLERQYANDSDIESELAALKGISSVDDELAALKRSMNSSNTATKSVDEQENNIIE